MLPMMRKTLPYIVTASLLLSAAPAGAGRTAILVYVPTEPSWRDMAYLAAVPAGARANGGVPVVIAAAEPDALRPETRDYLRRYRPDTVVSVDCRPPGAERLAAGSAGAAARGLAKRFWKTAETIVVCGEDDYAGALAAAAMAARTGAPLLFVPDGGPAAADLKLVRALGAKEVLAVNGAGAAALQKAVPAVRQIDGAAGILARMTAAGLKTDYIAAVNPADRTETVVKKISLAAPLLAAARGGAVFTLDREVRWKAGFGATPIGKKENIPAGLPNRKQRPRRGRIDIGGGRDFVFSGEKGDRNPRVNIDLDGDGTFDGAGEGPLMTADRVAIGGNEYVLSLGRKNGPGKPVLWLTRPAAEHVREDILRFARGTGTGRPPGYLCIAGFPRAVPAFIARKDPGSPADLQSDYPYANADGDPFAEIRVARLVAEDAAAATLYACRAVTCEDLAGGPWRYAAGEAMWENAYWPLFENAGFRTRVREDREDLPWIQKPGKDGKGGKRAKRIGPDSGLTEVAVLTHMAHSMWTNLGHTYWWDSTVLLAPAIVESGGCLTAALDRQAGCKSVVARLLRNGATAFHGNSRPGIAYQEQLRMTFWNRILAGDTVGAAHRAAQNSIVLSMLDTGQQQRGPNRYSLYIRMLFGDPAVRLSVPGGPKTAPAGCAVAGDTVTVRGPASWVPVKMRVPEDWKKWYGKDLWVCRGAGAYAVRHWCREQYDREELHVDAAITTRRTIRSIRQVRSPQKPLGWYGTYWADEHADGSRTYRWRVRVLDFDQVAGKIRNKLDRIAYHVAWE